MAKYRENSEDTWKTLKIKALDSMPIASGIDYYGLNTDIPTGWLLCDGSAVSRTEYSELFAKIGTYYGSGDGSTTFNLPNDSGRVKVSIDTNDADFDTIGKTGGSKELQAHTHTTMYSSQTINVASGSAATCPRNYPTQDTGSTGDGDSGNLQPYVVVCSIIKATNTTPTMGSIVNAYSTSTKDGYACDYLNNRVRTIESGLITSNNMTSATLGGNTGRKYNLTFEHTYETPPNVIVSYYNNASGSYGAIEVGFGQVTTTGCELYIFYNISSSNAGISYIVQGTSTD